MQKKGFTLLELLVVISIIGILSTIVLASLNTARTNAKESAVKQNMSQMMRQASTEQILRGQFPNDVATPGWVTDVSDCETIANFEFTDEYQSFCNTLVGLDLENSNGDFFMAIDGEDEMVIAASLGDDDYTCYRGRARVQEFTMTSDTDWPSECNPVGTMYASGGGGGESGGEEGGGGGSGGSDWPGYTLSGIDFALNDSFTGPAATTGLNQPSRYDAVLDFRCNDDSVPVPDTTTRRMETKKDPTGGSFGSDLGTNSVRYNPPLTPGTYTADYLLRANGYPEDKYDEATITFVVTDPVDCTDLAVTHGEGSTGYNYYCGLRITSVWEANGNANCS